MKGNTTLGTILRRGALFGLLFGSMLVVAAQAGAQDYQYGVLVDADNRADTGCTVGLNSSLGEGFGLISFEHAATSAAQLLDGMPPLS